MNAVIDTDKRTRMERRASNEAWRFELGALIHLLHYLGYTEDQILFKSVPTTCSQASLVSDIEFRRLPTKQVTVWLNMGLLGPQSPLPTYMFKMLDRSYSAAQSFTDFIHYFDHGLISTFLKSSYPEQLGSGRARWEELKSALLRLSDVRAPASVHWLMELVYPELDVRVRKRGMKQDILTSGMRLGMTRLGDASSLGNVSHAQVDAFVVELLAEDEMTTTGEPWAKAVRDRLDELLVPVLANMNFNLELFLVIREQSSLARLSDQSYLGYDRIRGGDVSRRRILIYRGRVD